MSGSNHWPVADVLVRVNSNHVAYENVWNIVGHKPRPAQLDGVNPCHGLAAVAEGESAARLIGSKAHKCARGGRCNSWRPPV